MPVRNHYIPRFVISEFADDDENVFLYRKSTRKVAKPNISKVFVVKDFYSDDVEETFSRVEGRISPIVRDVLRMCREGVQPTTTPEEVLSCFQYFFLLQLGRTPQAMRIGVEGIRESDPQDLYDEVQEILGIDMSSEDNVRKVEAMREDAIKDAERKRGSKLQSSLMRDLLADPSRILPDVAKAVKDKGLTIAKAGRSSFVLGDRGSVSTAGGGLKLHHPSREIFFPISPDVGLSLAGHRDQVQLVTLDGSAVRQINLSTMRISKYVVSRSKALLRSLSRPR